MDSLKNIKKISLILGRQICKVYDVNKGWREYSCQTEIPTDEKLTNFDLIFNNGAILCLDNYGNEIMSEEIHRHVMNGLDMFEYLLGIDKKTGEIYRVSFLKEKNTLSAAFSSLVSVPIILPKEYLERMDELKSKKRPFFLTLPEKVLFAFSERYYGYRDLDEETIVDLHFDKYRLQVGHQCWREITQWK